MKPGCGNGRRIEFQAGNCLVNRRETCRREVLAASRKSGKIEQHPNKKDDGNRSDATASVP